jgi:hypothetical protein
MTQVLHYPFATQLAAAERSDVIAWVCNLDGVRNVWVARGPAFTPAKVTQFTEDDGQEITQLTFSPDGTRLARRGSRSGIFPLKNWSYEATANFLSRTLGVSGD